jgi:hypothetical protein
MGAGAGALEIAERHPLVEPLEGLWMDGLETQGELEDAAEPLLEVSAAAIDQERVALDHDPLEGSGQVGQGGQVLRRHRPGLEEVAGIVELEPLDAGRELGHGASQLTRQGSRRSRRVEGVTPEVAEDTGERALGAGQEDGAEGPGPVPGGALGLVQNGQRSPRIDRRLGWPAAPDGTVVELQVRVVAQPAPCSRWKW